MMTFQKAPCTQLHAVLKRTTGCSLLASSLKKVLISSVEGNSTDVNTGICLLELDFFSSTVLRLFLFKVDFDYWCW
jgi:hypothetical protein